jgi:hypothetical protein
MVNPLSAERQDPRTLQGMTGRTKCRSAGGAASPDLEIDYADCASTVNVASLSGLAQTIDGVALNVAGKRVLLKNQSSAGNNGLWSVASGTWSKIGQPKVVSILNGTTQGQTFFMLTAANTYTTGGAYWK